MEAEEWYADVGATSAVFTPVNNALAQAQTLGRYGIVAPCVAPWCRLTKARKGDGRISADLRG